MLTTNINLYYKFEVENLLPQLFILRLKGLFCDKPFFYAQIYDSLLTPLYSSVFYSVFLFWK